MPKPRILELLDPDESLKLEKGMSPDEREGIERIVNVMLSNIKAGESKLLGVNVIHLMQAGYHIMKRIEKEEKNG